MIAPTHGPVLIVIAGPNGSGKTTITSKILKHEWLEPSVYINPDQVAQDMFGDWNSSDAVRKISRIRQPYFDQIVEKIKKSIF